MTRITPISRRQGTRNSLRIYLLPLTGFVSDSLRRKSALTHCKQTLQGEGEGVTTQ